MPTHKKVMEYSKTPLSVEDLARHLIGLGLSGEEALIKRRIRQVGYYRLSPYWRQFRAGQSAHESILQPGTTVEHVWRLYTFDRELRLLALDALERVEIGLRATIVQHHVQTHGVFGYARPEQIEGTQGTHYRKLIDGIAGELRHATDPRGARQAPEALRHFAETYGDRHLVPPLWVAAETFSFGDLVTLYKGSPYETRKAVARDTGLPEPILESWLLALHTMRNICAHHGRLWNRSFGTRPKVPHNQPLWSSALLGPTDRTMYMFSILAALFAQHSRRSSWKDRFRSLLNMRYPDIDKAPMGVRQGWEDHDLWRPGLPTAD